MPPWRVGWRDAAFASCVRSADHGPPEDKSGRSGEIQTTRHLGAPYPSLGGKGKETGHPKPAPLRGRRSLASCLVPSIYRCLTCEYELPCDARDSRVPGERSETRDPGAKCTGLKDHSFALRTFCAGSRVSFRSAAPRCTRPGNARDWKGNSVAAILEKTNPIRATRGGNPATPHMRKQKRRRPQGPRRR